MQTDYIEKTGFQPTDVGAQLPVCCLLKVSMNEKLSTRGTYLKMMCIVIPSGVICKQKNM